MIPFGCERCGKNFQAKDELAGKRTKCPKCGLTLRVPAAHPTVPAQMLAMPEGTSTDNPFQGLDNGPRGNDKMADQPKLRTLGTFIVWLITKPKLQTPGPFILWLIASIIFAQVIKRVFLAPAPPEGPFNFESRLVENLLANIIGGLPVLLLYVVLVAILTVGGILVESSQKCPKCSEPIPSFRKPSNRPAALSGGRTCPKCGCEVDRRVRKVEG